MIVYNTANGAPIQLAKADKSPSGRYNIPYGSTSIAPPEAKEGYTRAFIGGAWEYHEIPKAPEPTPEPEPTHEEKVAQHTAAVQAYMDETVQQRGYDNIHTACTYASSTDETFAKEGAACLVWRDRVWRKCYEILVQIEAGEREEPQGVEEIIAELPAVEW